MIPSSAALPGTARTRPERLPSRLTDLSAQAWRGWLLVGARWIVVLSCFGAGCLGAQLPRAVILASPLAVVASLRTWAMLGHRWAPHPAGALGGLIGEVGIAAGVAFLAGDWHSPWVVFPVAGAVVAGIELPARQAGSVAAAGAVLMMVAGITAGFTPLATGLVSSAVLTSIIGLTVAYASWVLARTEQRRRELADANRDLAAINAMLIGLDRESLGATDGFDPRRSARSIAETVLALLGGEASAVLAPTALPGRWEVLHASGVSMPPLVDDRDLPLGTAPMGGAVTRFAIGPAQEGISPNGSSGLRLALRSGQELIGLVLVEHPDPGYWAELDGPLAEQLVARATLMLDNARRFSSLWVVGAHEERTRVAHDLHDRLGQSLAGLGLQMDILARSMSEGADCESVIALRRQVTGMVRELRSTMRDLRLDVADDRPMAEVLRLLAADLNSRGPAEVSLEAEGGGRMPLAQEHQLLQVARQAITTAIVDAGAERVCVGWSCDGEAAVLTVEHSAEATDLAGMGVLLAASQIDAMRRMEDRCRAIGARLTTNERGAIRCEVGA